MTFNNHIFAHISGNLMSLREKKKKLPYTQEVVNAGVRLLCGNHDKRILSNKIYQYSSSKRLGNNNKKVSSAPGDGRLLEY